MPSFRAGLIARSAMGGAGVALSNATVAANATIGTTVGTLSVVGGTGTYTYSLTSNPGGLYAISGSSLNVAAALSPGTTPVTVQAIGGVPTPLSNVFAITVTPVPVVPANTVLPVISGTTAVDQTLTTTNGTWTGFPAPGFTYQWKRGGVAISGATASSYLLVSADAGTNITVTVTATNTAGNASATSSAVGPITAAVGPPTYTLTAGAGDFALAGTDMTTVTEYILTAGTMAVAVAGTNANLVYSSAATYTGPGDVAGYSGAYEYWGLRAYNAAKATALVNCIDVVDQAGGHLTTIHVTAAGDLNLTELSAWVTANSVTRIGVRRLYGQVNGYHLSSLTGQEPALILSGVGLGSKPSIAFDGGDTNSPWLISASNAVAQSQPFTISTVARYSAGRGGGIYGDGGFGIQLFNGADATIRIYAGSGVQIGTGVADTQFGSIQCVYNGASSSTNAANAGTNPTGTPTTTPGSPGTGGITTGNKHTVGGLTDVGNALMNGHIFEVMIIPSAVSPANQASQVSNQRTYGGF
jgi:hypothetical protein